MKKLSILLVACVAMISCGNTYTAKKVDLADRADSLNYALGVFNGSYMQKDICKPNEKGEVPAISDAQVSEIADALDRGFNLSVAESTGFDFGSFVASIEDKGLNGNPVWRVNEKLLLQGFVNGLHGDSVVVKREEAQNYITDKFYKAKPEEGTPLPAVKANAKNKVKPVVLANEVDSLNYIFGFLNGEDIFNYAIARKDGKETSEEEREKDIAALINKVNEGLQVKYINSQLVRMVQNYGSQLKQMEASKNLLGLNEMPVKFEVLRQALINGLRGYEQGMQSEEANTYLQTVVDGERERQGRAEHAERIAAEEAFLAKNAERAEVTVTESGLQYEILKQGKGKCPTATDKVRVHYHGTLLDGTVFDSSVDRKQSIVFGVNQVIAGWTEALQLMPVGSKWKLYIPYELGYQGRQAGSIPPYSMLIFEVELLGIEEPEAPAAE